tara:strand:+ start:68 stop:583 length:516 start_codon:yes stop_codon:yes gene_type:complete
MPLYTNNTKGTVTHGTGEFDSSIILENDLEVLNSTAYQSAFNINLGKSERIIFRTFLYFDYNAAGDIKYRILTPTGTTRFLAVLRQSELPISGAIVETVTQYAGSSGTGEVTAAGATGQHFAWVQYGIVETPGSYASDASKVLDVQFTQQTASDVQATTLKAGSYIEYKKF